MRDWGTIIAVLLIVGWFSWAIDKTGDKIIERIDQLEAKIDELQSKHDES